MCLIKNNLWKIFVPHQMSSKQFLHFINISLSRDKSLSQIYEIFKENYVINKYSLRRSLKTLLG